MREGISTVFDLLNDIAWVIKKDKHDNLQQTQLQRVQYLLKSGQYTSETIIQQIIMKPSIYLGLKYETFKMLSDDQIGQIMEKLPKKKEELPIVKKELSQRLIKRIQHIIDQSRRFSLELNLSKLQYDIDEKTEGIISELPFQQMIKMLLKTPTQSNIKKVDNYLLTLISKIAILQYNIEMIFQDVLELLKTMKENLESYKNIFQKIDTNIIKNNSKSSLSASLGKFLHQRSSIESSISDSFSSSHYTDKIYRTSKAPIIPTDYNFTKKHCNNIKKSVKKTQATTKLCCINC